jgi:hypothetical protein
LIEEIGFDGFRFDYVKGYGASTVAAIQEYRYMRAGQPYKPYGVAEHWDSAQAIEYWVNVTNFSNSNPVDAFDFPLREMLKACATSTGSACAASSGHLLKQPHPPSLSSGTRYVTMVAIIHDKLLHIVSS